VLQWKYNTGNTGNTWDPVQHVQYLTEIKKLCAIFGLYVIIIEIKVHFVLPDNTTAANNIYRGNIGTPVVYECIQGLYGFLLNI
jgi:hypothetical protein